MPFSAMTGALGYQKDSVRLPIPLNAHSVNRNEGFVYKYGPDGQALWGARMTSPGDGGTTNGAFAQGTATDSTGAVYAVGRGFLNSSSSRFIAYQTLFYNADGSFGGSVSLPPGTTPPGPFCVKYSATGTFQWAVTVTPPVTVGNRAGYAYAVAVDSSDNVYFTGAVGGSSTFAGVITAYNADGTAFGTTYPNRRGNCDAFLVKYNASGVAQWLTRVASDEEDVGRGLAIDSTGVYMVGDSQSSSSAIFTAYNADGTAFGTTVPRAGSDDMFIVKYTLTGTVSWVAGIRSTSNDNVYAAALDSAGNLVMAVATNGTATTVYNSDGTAFGTIATAGSTDPFVVKYSSTGSVQWIAKMGGTAGDVGFGITTDSGNNVYITGYQGAATFTAFNSDGTAFGTTFPARANTSAFLVKYNSTGFVQWVAQMDRSSGALGYAVVSDTSDNIHVALRAGNGTVVYNSDGTTFATVSATTSPATCLVTYNSSGTALRTRVLNFGSSPLSACRDSDNNIFVGGSFTASVAQNLGPSTTIAFTLPTRGSLDAVVVKYSTYGSPLWAARICGTAQDNAYGVTTDSSGNIYVTGGIGGTLGAGAGRAFNANGTGFGSGDTINFSSAFLVKYNSVGFVQWDVSWTAPAGLRVAVDSAGNAYVCGIGVPVTNVLSAFNPSGSSTRITQSTSGTNPAMLVKYNTNGIPQWIARIATTNSHAFNGVAVDSSDNVIAVGRNSTNGVVFNANGTSFATIAGGAVVVKYNSSGVVQWVARMLNATEVQAVTCDVSGNVYVAGYGGTTTVGVTIYNANETTFTTLPVASGTNDGFVVKYNSAGVAQWAARIVSGDTDVPRSLATDLDGNLYLGGNSGDSNSLNTTPALFFNADGTRSTVGTGTTKSGSVGWLVKYSPSGRVQWNIWFDGGSSPDVVYDVATDRRGAVYAGGAVGAGPSYVVDLGNAGSANNITSKCVNAAKFTPQGLLQWYQMFAPAGTDKTATSGLATDPDCNLIVVGTGGFTETNPTNIYAKA